MAYTISEKILMAHCNKHSLSPGEIVFMKLDGVLANDVTAPIALREMFDMGYKHVFDKRRVYFVMDHFTPNATQKAADQSKFVRDFALGEDLPFFYDVGDMGIEHALLPESGLVGPGELVIGGDSHTCTYGALGAFATGVGSTDVAAGLATGELWMKVPESILVNYQGKLNPYVTGKDLILHLIGKIGVDGALYGSLEFAGDAISSLSMDGRFTMCNMAIEAGAKNGIIVPDEKTRAYADAHNLQNKSYWYYESDADANYAQRIDIDVQALEPVVACPHLPSNTRFVSELKDIVVDQVVIGSCTNGRIEDLRAAAELMKGKKVNRRTRAIIIPASQKIYKQAIKEGLVDIFIDAGAAVSTPTCGPCFGGHMGLLADDEVCVSTTNRNFIGRMGSKKSMLYLANPAVAAAAALAGRLVHPKEV